MAGLKICTRWRAISARRRRRISSSLLPENIGPTTTSIHPMLPLTMSTQFSLGYARQTSTTVSCPHNSRCLLNLAHAACYHVRVLIKRTGAACCATTKKWSTLTCGCGVAIRLPIVERSEGGEHGNAKGLGAADQVAGE